MRLLESFSAIATAGPLVGPIWIAFLFILLSFLRGPLLRLLLRALHLPEQDLGAELKRKIDGPLQLLFVTLAFLPFTFLIEKPLGPALVLVVHTLAFALLFHILIQITDLAIFNWYMARKQAQVAAVVRVFVLSILYAVGVMLLLDWAIGVSVLPLLATSTVVTAVLGLAMQDTLKNAFAGLSMSLENSFEQGDWVLFRVDATEQWFGQIAEIGWRTTKIRTLSNNYAIIPNSKFTMHELINYNRPTRVHALTVLVPISLKADAAPVETALLRCAKGVEGVLEDPAPEVVPIEFKTDHVVYQVRFWVGDASQREQLTGAIISTCWQEMKELGALALK